jgi:hypothetical protein
MKKKKEKLIDLGGKEVKKKAKMDKEFNKLYNPCPFNLIDI